MLVYGHRSFPLDVPAFVRGLAVRLEGAPVSPPRELLMEWLVDFAEAESAVADAYSADRDDDDPELQPWRDALQDLAHAVCAADARDAGVFVERVGRALPLLPVPTQPVRAKVAEGFSCYALYPEQYVDAAQQCASVDDDRSIVCIGIRSIGSVLAAVVAATLRDRGKRVDTRTVRPRGHPFDRRVVLGARLERFLAERASESTFMIVDEGPGISGSSFAAVVDTLTTLGAPRHRIVLVPSWRCDPLVLRSVRALHAFSTCRVVVGRSPVERKAHAALGTTAADDLSAGRWRSFVAGERDRWPAVLPQHERVKFRGNDGAVPLLARFAGLGRHGRDKLARQELLAGEGFGPEPVRFAEGFLVRRWVHGRSLASDAVSPPLVDRFADYAAFVRTRFAQTDVDEGHDLVEMMRHNAAEALGASAAGAIERLIDSPRDPAPLVAVDGRMLPHEWIDRADDRGAPPLKVDAIDHHADDFLPGCRDIAWDLAGACVEMQLADEARHRLVNRYMHLTGDSGVGGRLTFYAAAYLAYRLGYTTMATEALGDSDEGTRFRELRERYRRSLAAHVARRPRAAAR